MRLCDSARLQHGGATLMLEVAIGEAETRDGAAEASVVLLVDVEARLERQSSERGANVVAADLQRIAGQPDVSHRAGAGKLHGACGTHIFEDSARAASAVKARESEHLACHELACLVCRHRSCKCGCDHGAGGNGPQ